MGAKPQLPRGMRHCMAGGVVWNTKHPECTSLLAYDRCSTFPQLSQGGSGQGSALGVHEHVHSPFDLGSDSVPGLISVCCWFVVFVPRSILILHSTWPTSVPFVGEYLGLHC